MLPSDNNFFDANADRYSRCRPGYPNDLFTFLASWCNRKECAWDCGTGNGQAARSLAASFDSVIATDIASNQIAKAVPHPKITFRVAGFDNSGLKDKSVDLVTVAQAVHWFDFGRFFSEVDRVTKTGGVLAIWCYCTPKVAPDIDELVDGLYDAPGLISYWPDERRHIDNKYANIPLPFREITVPEFTIVEEWGWQRFEDYLRTWKGVADSAAEPLASLFVTEQIAKIAAAWGSLDLTHPISWRLWVRASVKET